MTQRCDRLTPDGVRYLAMAQGERVPRPFSLRFLLPRLCGKNTRSWQVAQGGAWVVSAGLLGAYTGRWWACILLLGCSGLTRFNLRHPVLVDLPAFALALGAAVTWQQGAWWAAIPLVLLAGCAKETAPVFAAVWAWHPILTVGLVSPVLRSALRPGPDPCPSGPATEALQRPVRASWQHHKKLPLWVYVLPWGVCLAALAHPSPQLWVAVGLAYAQLIVATDAVRLYQWALPAMALQAAGVLAGPWLAVALVVHVVNPFATEGL